MEGYDTNVAAPANPGANATAVLFDSTADLGTGTTLAHRRQFPHVKRAEVTIYCDQVVTFLFKGLAATSSTPRTINGSGSGEATVANTWFQRDCLIESDDFQLVVTTTTAPATWEVTVRLSPQRAIGQ